MTFNWIDMIVGLLFVEAFLTLSFYFQGLKAQSLFGKTPKAMLLSSLAFAIAATDIYFFTHGMDAMWGNGLLIGFIDAYILYLVFGKWIHKKMQSSETKTQRDAIAAN